MVQEVMKFLDDTPNTDVKLSVIETLRTVTEGKVRYRAYAKENPCRSLALTRPLKDLRRS